MSWIQTAKVGDRVVCIDDKPRKPIFSNHIPAWDDDAPVVGNVYTISRIWVDLIGSIVFEFDELKRNPGTCQKFCADLGYGAYRFRPVQSRPTDISVFQRLLNTVPSEMEEA